MANYEKRRESDNLREAATMEFLEERLYKGNEKYKRNYEEKQLLLKDLCARLPHGEWEYLVACQKELRQLELQILNHISVQCQECMKKPVSRLLSSF
jgi:hypothetical protein